MVSPAVHCVMCCGGGSSICTSLSSIPSVPSKCLIAPLLTFVSCCPYLHQPPGMFSLLCVDDAGDARLTDELTEACVL